MVLPNIYRKIKPEKWNNLQGFDSQTSGNIRLGKLYLSRKKRDAGQPGAILGLRDRDREASKIRRNPVVPHFLLPLHTHSHFISSKERART